MVHDRVPDVERACSHSDEDMEEDTDEIIKRRERKELSDRASRISQCFGNIPGVKIGATWNSRQRCSLAGVHRPLMAGIHGTKNSGAYSIVVSCHYDDDKDLGDTIIYTGAGGRQRWITGSDGSLKRFRLGPQIHDQSWNDWGNEALVTSRDTGNPVRVIRSHKTVSDYAPLEGYRYDGLYTVEAAWQEKNPQCLDICRYRLERIPGQPLIPRRPPQDPEGKTRKKRTKKSSSVSVATSDTAVATSQSSPADFSLQPSGDVAPPPVAHLTPLQRHKQRVMQEMQMLEQIMGQGSSARRP